VPAGNRTRAPDGSARSRRPSLAGVATTAVRAFGATLSRVQGADASPSSRRLARGLDRSARPPPSRATAIPFSGWIGNPVASWRCRKPCATPSSRW
jgi:hypothetical protein